MSDEQDRPMNELPESDGPRGGERLAEARREQQISVLEIAKELHLDEPKVRALERNDFDVLGAPVFAKGHLRKYAQLVGVDEADVFADYYAMTRSEAMPPLVVGRRRVAQDFSPGPWIAIFAILLVAAGGYWWFAVREVAEPASMTTPEQAEPGSIQPEPLNPEQLQPEELDSTGEGAEADEGVSGDDPGDDDVLLATASPPEPAAEAVVTTSLPTGQVQLSVQFSGDCWTEIRDADGRQLFFDMGRGGRTVNVRGKAPISALFGNGDSVRLQVNGVDYQLPEPNRVNGTIRVAILDQ